MQGRIKLWKDEAGYGFIEPFDDGVTVFFHITAMPWRVIRPQEGETVLFDVTQNEKGQLRAINVRRPGHSSRRFSLADLFFAVRRVALSVFALLFLATLWHSFAQGKLPAFILWTFAGTSLLTFYVYRRDKWAAKHDFRRVQEMELHVLAFLGGWPGALLGQQVFRHKCSKLSFQAIFWLMVTLNCATLVSLNLLAEINIQWPQIPRELQFLKDLRFSREPKINPELEPPNQVPPHEIKIRPRIR